jgi:hypothetical protein
MQCKIWQRVMAALGLMRCPCEAELRPPSLSLPCLSAAATFLSLTF